MNEENEKRIDARITIMLKAHEQLKTRLECCERSREDYAEGTREYHELRFWAMVPLYELSLDLLNEEPCKS